MNTPTVDELQTKLGQLAIQRRKAAMAVAAVEHEQREAGLSGLPVDKYAWQYLRDEVKAAKAEYERLDMAVVAAEADMAAAQKRLQRPGLEKRLAEAKKLKTERVQLSRDVQASLDNLSRQLVALTRNTAAMHAVERLPDDRGVSAIGRDFHSRGPLKHRLKFPLSKAFRRTSYASLVYQDNLPKPELENFVQVETRACDSLIHDLQRQINEIDELERERAS